ncbi:MAG: S8 family serine peptidase [Thermofilum sp.]
MDRLSAQLERVYRGRSICPVIVEAFSFDDVKHQLLSLIPSIKSSLSDMRIFRPFGIPLFGWKEIGSFKMISLSLTPSLIEEVAQWRSVKRVYLDQVKWAISREGVYADRKGNEFTSTFWTKRVMGLDRANAQGYTGRGVSVAVIDTGARSTHPQIRKVKSMTAMPEKGGTGEDTSGHGTWCCSCIGGSYDVDRRYGVPVEGMAPDCNIVSIQALGFVIGVGSSSDIIKAMEMASKLNCKIVSMSLGSEDQIKDEDNPESVAINALVEKNIIPVVAAGNSGPKPETVGSPGSCLNSLTVGAYDTIGDCLADFSSRGPTADGYIKPDVVAPGHRVDSALVGLIDLMTDRTQPRYGPISGTSMATPHVSGLLACMSQLYSAIGKVLTVDEVKKMMASLGPNQPKDNEMGWGMITWKIVEEWVSTQYGHEAERDSGEEAYEEPSETTEEPQEMIEEGSETGYTF